MSAYTYPVCRLWLLLFLCLIRPGHACAQDLLPHQRPGMGNPIIPGYFADPTIKKIGDTFYLYATTDGNGGGFGPSQVWTSKDFVNWTIQPMNWPTTHWYWAPDMTKGYDGRYYLYYCQPVELYGAVSDNPTGPWTPLLPAGKAMVPNYYIPGVITLDGQTFTDDDGKIYLFWGTWGIYPDHGSGVALLNKDMTTLSDARLIPNTVAKDFFEGPFMFKRKGVYYFMYSSGRCEDDTYRVQYVKSTVGPMGPFEYPAENPILSTSADGSVHGPGHHSILKEGDDYYIVYHRHNNPHSGGGFHRQIATDKLEFDESGNIKKVVPTHQGIGLLGKNSIPNTDLAYGKSATASSYYSEDFRPQFAADQNNGTLWKSADNMKPAWLQVDLGAVHPVRTIHTQFEYAMWYYEYLIEYSTDGKSWKIFADKRTNRRWGSPMIDAGDVQARYIRIHIYNTQIPGLFKAIWNIRVFSEAGVGTSVLSPEQPSTPNLSQQGLLLELNAADAELGERVKIISDKGTLKGEWTASGNLFTSMIAGKQAFVFSGQESLRSSFAVPVSVTGNSSYTVAMWVYNPEIGRNEPIFGWTSGTEDFSRGVIGYGSDRGAGAITHGGWTDMGYRSVPAARQWHHIAVTFDGYIERIYVDGREDRSANKMIFMKGAEKFTVGEVGTNQHFDGALASLKMYDEALTAAQIRDLMASEPESGVLASLEASEQRYGPLKVWPNEGTLQSTLAVVGAAKVTSHQGLIAVKFGPEGKLLLTDPFKAVLSASSEYTLSMAVCTEGTDNAWHQLTWTKKNGKGAQYIDGQLAIPGKAVSEINPLNLNQRTIDLAHLNVASIRIENKAWQAAEAAKQYARWLAHHPSGLSSMVPEFAVKPHMISDSLLYMKALTSTNTDQGIFYSFIETTSGKSSPWIKEPTYFSGLPATGQKYTYVLHVKDRYGNVSQPSAVGIVDPEQPGFTQLVADFSQKQELTPASRAVPAPWDGFVGSGESDSVGVKAQIGNGLLTLSSARSHWDGNDPKGPFLYKEISGDFLAEATVSDVSGQAQKRGSSNESGLMVRYAGNGEGRRAEHLLQSGIMTGWNVGNLVTTLTNGRRGQQNNGAGWNYYNHLQIQRNGTIFYLRGSRDGKEWTDLPGSPYERKDLEGQAVQVGVYQASNDNSAGYGRFNGFKLFIPSKQR